MSNATLPTQSTIEHARSRAWMIACLVVIAVIACVVGRLIAAPAAPAPAAPAAPAKAAPVEVEFRLVPFDQPDKTVDQFDRRKPVVNPVPTAQGVVMQEVGIDTVVWARNVQLDGKPLFERYYENRYVDRLPIAKATLAPGEHTLWPGEHKFTIDAEGKIVTTSAELVVDGKTLRIKAYPVTVAAMRANPAETDLPASMREASMPNMTVRDASDYRKNRAAPDSPDAAAGKAGASRDLLPVFDKFAPLTVWLPANTSEQGYVVHPLGLTFHLSAKGIEPGAGGGETIEGLRVAGTRIEVPLYGFPVYGEAGTSAIVPGVESIAGAMDYTNWYPRKSPYELRVAEVGPSLSIDGDVTKLPLKAIRVVRVDGTVKSQRAMALEMPGRQFKAGEKVRVRLRAVDPTPAVLAKHAVTSAKASAEKADVALNEVKKQIAAAEQAVKASQEAAKKAEPAGGDALTAAQTKAKEAEAKLAELQPKLAQVESAAASAKAAIEPAETALKGVLETNAASDWVASGTMHAYGAKTPVDLALTAIPGSAAAREYDITIPADAEATVHTITLTMRSPADATKEMSLSVRVGIAGETAIGVGVFTSRGRDAFARGESFWLAVGVRTQANQPVPAGTPLEIDLVDAAGTRLPLLRHTTAEAIKDRATFIARVTDVQSRSLAAGVYRVEAKIATRVSRPYTITLADTEPETHFGNLLNGKYNLFTGGGGFGSDAFDASYNDVLRTGRNADRLADEIVGAGYNAFMGMAYSFDRSNRFDAELEQIVRDRPELGPWESYYQATGRDRVMSAALRKGIAFYEDIITYNDTMIPREQKSRDAARRYLSLEVQSMRSHPAFRGVCLYDEFYNISNIGIPGPTIAAMETAEELDFRAKHAGLTGPKSSRAMDRFLAKPPGQRNREDLENFLAWGRFQDGHWSNFSKQMQEEAKSLAPRSRNFAQTRGWGSLGENLATNGTTMAINAPMDLAVPVMYKDGGTGDRPVFGAVIADAMRVREDMPVYTQLHAWYAPGIYGDHLVRQTFLALSRGIQGVSFFTITFDPAHPKMQDDRDTIRTITRHLTIPYGDFFLSLDRGYRKVAIVYSREADLLSPRKSDAVSIKAEGLWLACLRAGFPAEFVFDDGLLRGDAMKYDAIFVPGFMIEDEASPAMTAAIQKLVNAGKLVIVERSSKLTMEGLARMESEFDEFADRLGGAFPRYVDFEFTSMFDRTEETTALVRDFLSAKNIEPAARHHMLMSPGWLRRGQGQYLVAANFADTGFSGTRRTLYQPPASPVVRFKARPPVAYDVLEMKRVEPKVDGEWMSLPLDMRDYPGKVIAFLPAAIERVALRAAASVTGDEELRYEASVVDAAGKAIDASFPLDITLSDPTGKAVQNVYRAASPRFEGAYRPGVNAPGGAWTLRVRELISGAVSEAKIQVTAGKLKPIEIDARPVLTSEPARVAKFLASKEPVRIVLDTDQKMLQPAAERLQRALAAGGRDATIVTPEQVVTSAGGWDREKGGELDGKRLWRGDIVQPGFFIDAHVVLLGGRYESRLIEALVRRNVLDDPLTTQFPGPGKALVNVSPRVFSAYHDTLSVLGMDAAGVNRGVDDVIALLGKPATSDTTRDAPQEQPRAATLADAPATSRAATPLSRAACFPDWVRTIEVDAATGRTLVATTGYGHNLFCFAPDGKLLWRQFLPEHNVYFARFVEKGSKVIAATGRGYFCFVLDSSNGSVLKKVAATEWPDYHNDGPINSESTIIINEALRQVLLVGKSGVAAMDFDGKPMWFHDRASKVADFPPEADRSGAASFPETLVLGNIALAPDGAKLVCGEYEISGSTKGRAPGELATVWSYRAMILDARTGKVLCENNDDPGNQTHPGGWSVSWPATSPDPLVHTKGLTASLKPDGKLGEFSRSTPTTLKSGDRLLLTWKRASRLAADGKTLWTLTHEQTAIPECDARSEDESRLYRVDRNGLVQCIDTATGKTLWTYVSPWAGVLRPTADGVIVGDKAGNVAKLDASGRVAWSVKLREIADRPAGDYAAYVAAAMRRDVDSSGDFYPFSHDKPGEYAKVFRPGIDQLVNGVFANADAWSVEGGAVKLASPGHKGSGQALQLEPGKLVTQPITRRVIPSATYLLEFYFNPGVDTATLTAGVEIGEGGKTTFTASNFIGRTDRWTFGRLAIKTPPNAATMMVGFESAGGAVLVSEASLKPVRFPSANLVANSELALIAPTFVKDIRVQYERIPSALKERLMSRNHVVAYKQGGGNTATIYTQEQAFLHNGRLDDIGDIWAWPPDTMGFSVVLRQPSWVSHLVLYLNNAEPANTYRTIAIHANNMETKLPELVAMVRGNDKRFVVVHFEKPILTDSIRILPKHPGHHECLTEVEVYGPLGGPEMASAGATPDADAWPMLMATPAHVPAKLPGDLLGEYVEAAKNNVSPTFQGSSTVLDNVFTFGGPTGSVGSIRLPADFKTAKTPSVGWGPSWGLQTLAPLGTPARHMGRLIVGSADYKVHAVADNGTYLWGFPTGGRVYSSPTASGDDVYIGSDDGKLYKLDVHSGALLWEFTTGAAMRGSPAMADGRVFFTSGDGSLYAVDAESGLVAWKAAIAPNTRASPAIAGGRVYVGDEAGNVYAFDAKAGSPVWKQTLNGYVSYAPLLTPEGILFTSEQGDIALLGTDGSPKWKQSLNTRVLGQPIATQSQVVLPTVRGLIVLARGDGQPDARFKPPPQAGPLYSALVYRDAVLMVMATASTRFDAPPRTYAQYWGQVVVWRPKPAEGGK